MIRISFAAGVGISTVGGLLLSSLVQAAEIKVLASVALTAALNELAPQYERTTGNKLSLGYSLVADIRKRVLEGETADVIILSRPVMDELQKQDKLTQGSIADVAGIAVAVTTRAGAPKPDISTVDALKRSLLAAKSVVYADPAKGGLSGVYFARVLDRLGIADQMKPKTVLVPGDQSAEVVAKGEAEIGVAQTSEIIPVSGAQLVGPLPGDLNLVTVFSAGLGAGTKAPDAATSYVKFITGPTAAAVLKARGMDPK
jgi:molybdate transport system substrate-binding protein